MRPPLTSRRVRRPRLETLEPRVVLATTLVVNSFADTLNPPAGTVTLRSAIETASASAVPVTIDIATPGTYRLSPTQATSNPNSGGALTYTGTSNLAIINTSGGNVTILGDGRHSVLSVAPSNTTAPFAVAVQGLTITGGGQGGISVVSSAASLIVIASAVTGNATDTDGGGIDMPGGTGALTVASSQITNNVTDGYTTEGDGGGIAWSGSGPVSISQSTIANNSAHGGGGGVFVSGAPLSMTGSIVRGNAAFFANSSKGGGGGIDHYGAGAVALNGVIVEGNVSQGDGGGYDDAGTGLGNLSVSNSFFLTNTARNDGGGIATAAPSVAIANTTLQGNASVVFVVDATSGGGGLYVGPGSNSGSTTPSASNVTVTGSTIANNRAYFGGGIEFDGSHLGLLSSTIEGNIAFSLGGGLQMAADNVAVSANNDVFRNNSAKSEGGAIYQIGVGSALGLFEDEFTGNSADYGGAIYSSPLGTSTHIYQGLFAIGTTFDANFASLQGGAVYLNTNYINVALTNDTFATNAAGKYNSPGLGGAIRYFANQAGDTVSFVNDTINNNTATQNGGGVYQDTGKVVAQNTIFALNTAAGAASDYYFTGATVTDGGGNLISSLNGTGGQFAGDTYIGSIGLGPLMDNGTTFSGGAFFARAGAPSSQEVIPTEALLPGSPAFVHGVLIGSPSNDARGFTRPASGVTKPSSGAYEPQYASTATPNQVYVENLYEVDFNRVADASGLATWTGYLNSGGSPTILAQTFGNSAEALTLETIGLARRYLGRTPSAGDIGAIVGFLQAGHTPEQVAASFVSSPEFFNRYGGSQDLFVEAAYQTILGRGATAPEVSAWNGVLNSGLSRSAAAAAFLSSQEYLVDVIDADFAAYLGRPATPADVTAYLNAARFGATTPYFRAVLQPASYGART